MDPNAALADLRIILADGEPEDAVESFCVARTTFRALDEWLSNGGFQPRAWVGRFEE